MQAITDGFKGSIHSMQESCGLQAKEVVHMMLVTQVGSAGEGPGVVGARGVRKERRE